MKVGSIKEPFALRLPHLTRTIYEARQDYTVHINDISKKRKQKRKGL